MAGSGQDRGRVVKLSEAPKKKRSGLRTTSFQLPESLYQAVVEVAEGQQIPRTQLYLRAIDEYLRRHTREGSSWDFADEDDDYDPLMFYTASQDGKGHSTTMRTNVPKPIAAEVYALVEARSLPAYRSAADFQRDAIVHRLKVLAKLMEDDELEAVVDLEMAIATEVALHEKEQQARDLIEAVRKSIEMMKGQEQWRKLRAYAADRKDSLAEALTDPHRGELVKMLDAAAKLAKGEMAK